MSRANLGLPEYPNSVSDVADPVHSRGWNNSRRVRPKRQPPSQNRAKSQHRQHASLDLRCNKLSNPELSFGPRTEPTDKDACSADKAFEWNQCHRAVATPTEHPKIPDLPTSSPGTSGRAHGNPTRRDNDRAPTARAHPPGRCLL